MTYLRQRIWRMLGIAGLWLLISTLSATQVYIGQRSGMFPTYPFSGLFVLHLLNWLPWILVTPLVFRFGKRFTFGRECWRSSLAIHLGLSIAIAFAKLLFDNTLAFVSEGEAVFQMRFIQNYTAVVAMSLHTQVLVYWLILSSRYAFEYFHKARAARRKDYHERLTVKSMGNVDVVMIRDIDWIGAADYYVEIHAGGKTHLLRETMTRLESRLDPSEFARIHRSTIVRIDRVQRLKRQSGGDYTVILKDGTSLRMSRSRRKSLQAVIHETA